MKSKEYSGQKERRGQNHKNKMINKTLHKSLKIAKHELHLQQGMNPGDS